MEPIRTCSLLEIECLRDKHKLGEAEEAKEKTRLSSMRVLSIKMNSARD